MVIVLTLIITFGLLVVGAVFYGLGYRHGVHAERDFRRQLEELKKPKP